MYKWPPLEVKVWGDFACFTRPEMKVERVSYPALTPSAARGILESIFWKPEFSWRIVEILVLSPIRYMSILRNEIRKRQSYRAARRWSNTDGAFLADEDQNRTQRHTLALVNPSYLIRAQVHLNDTGDHEAKYRDQFRRHVKRGRCFQQPYLGCREFAASFAPPDGTETPIPVTQDLGQMLFDVTFRECDEAEIEFVKHGEDGKRWVSGQARPVFFRAALDNGVLQVPNHLYEMGEENAP